MVEKKQIVESIPNFSEGRRPDVVEKIADAFRPQNRSCRLLNYSSDSDHNRSVFTVLGEREAVRECILNSVGVAKELINMEKHTGEHPRIGATDVIPFVPILNCSMEDCIRLSEEVGSAIYANYEIPVYLYEESARLPERRDLANIRKGEYEGLKKEISERAPDIGEAKMHPTAGATVVGARKPLIAYNINLSTHDVSIAKQIAKRVRARTGGLMYVKALGVMLSDRNIAQVSMNLTDYKKSAMYTIFEMVKMEAARYGVIPIGSEVIGLLPMEALIEAGRYYLQLENFTSSQILETHLIET